MILCVGLATVDLVYRVDRIPGVDEKCQATGMEIAAGGPAANAAVTAAALGAPVTLVTAVGRHPLGELLRADLQAWGVRLVDAAADSVEPPPVSAVTVLETTGERTVVSRNAGGRAVGVPDAGLPDAELTLVDGHHPALAVQAAHSARRLLVDAGSWRPVFAEIFRYAEVVAASADFRHPDAGSADRRLPATEASRSGEAAGVGSSGAGVGSGSGGVGSSGAGVGSGSPGTRSRAADLLLSEAVARADAATAAATGAPGVVVTHGPDPVRWFQGGQSGVVPVPPVAAVDTTGAGDAFHGALAVALSRGDDLPGAVADAIRVAGIRVAHRGPRAWLRALAR